VWNTGLLPEGLGLILPPTSSFVAHLEKPNHAPLSLLVKESDASVAFYEK
jgi:hypothetical protein